MRVTKRRCFEKRLSHEKGRQSGNGESGVAEGREAKGTEGRQAGRGVEKNVSSPTPSDRLVVIDSRFIENSTGD